MRTPTHRTAPQAPTTPSRAPVRAGATTTPAASIVDVPALLSADERVLVIGDSHTAGQFGWQLRAQLDRWLSDGGGELIGLRGVPGTTISDWLKGGETRLGDLTLKTPRLVDLLADAPDVLVVALGSNLLGRPSAQVRREVEALLSLADDHGTRVVWIGPPDVRGFQGEHAGGAPTAAFYSTLRMVNEARGARGQAQISVVDSRPSTHQEDTFDGMHFRGDSAKAWASDVLARLKG